MNLWDSAYQRLGFPAATYSRTDQLVGPEGVSCRTTLSYEGLVALVPEDWDGNFNSAYEEVNHALNKTIVNCAQHSEEVEIGDKRTIVIYIEVAR